MSLNPVQFGRYLRTPSPSPTSAWPARSLMPWAITLPGGRCYIAGCTSTSIRYLILRWLKGENKGANEPIKNISDQQ